MFLHPHCAFVFKIGIMKTYSVSSTTIIYCLNRKNVLHHITINTTCFGFSYYSYFGNKTFGYY